MSLRQMEYFLTVIEEDSFTRAAEALYVTQSALSHQIKALEHAVGGPLLERLPRGVRLTPMGRAYLPHAARAVRSAAQARRAARAAAVEGGELHIAALHALALGVMPRLFAQWRRLHPGTVLHLHEFATTEALEEQVQRGAADLAFGPPPRDWTGTVREVGTEEIVLVVPFDDALAGRTEGVRLAELADRDWVRCALEPVVHGQPFLDHACALAGFTPRTAVRTEHTSTAVRMAAAGLGLSVVPAHVARESVGEDCALVTLDPPWSRPVCALSRRPPEGAAAGFVDLVVREWREGAGRAVSAAPA
ncbi:LysR family transcriptional regulator [Streptomyces sp. NPDC049954]|uniref:LysR family transcriptional regulator n=1 Tax=Streptomyces sp. NPDC049954 TaxID=3155779 RepID=UPI003422F0A2